MATHNFQVFDSANANMTTDEHYTSDTTRMNGAQINTPADPYSFNKSMHQATIMASAIAQFMANNGTSSDDSNQENLTAAIAKAFVAVGMITYADRAAHGFLGNADVGPIAFCPKQPTPSKATYAAGTAGNLLGSYHYREVLISGYKNLDGTYYVNGFSPAAKRSSYDISPKSQQVVISNLPLGSAGCIGRAIYRSAAGGAAGSEKFCGVIWDNTTTTHTDNLTDLQLGAGMPTVQGKAIPASVPTANTTGTTLDVSQIVGGVTSATFGGVTVPKVGQQLRIPFSLFNNSDAKDIKSSTTPNLKTVTVPGYYRVLNGAGFQDSPFPKLSTEEYHPFMLLVMPVDGTRVLQTAFSLYQCGDIKQRLVYSSTNASFWFPDFDKFNNSTQHYCRYADGRQHQWGTYETHMTVTVPWGNMYHFQGYQIGLPIEIENDNDQYVPSIYVGALSTGDLVPCSPRLVTKTSFQFDVISPTQVTNLDVIFNYSIWGRNVHIGYGP